MRSLANDKNTVFRNTDKGSCVVFWDCEQYIADGEEQMGDKNVYKDIDFKEKILQELAETCNSSFRNIKKKGCITKKEFKYFSFELKKATNLGKLYLLPKIYKRLFDVLGRPVISNCSVLHGESFRVLRLYA